MGAYEHASSVLWGRGSMKLCNKEYDEKQRVQTILQFTYSTFEII